MLFRLFDYFLIAIPGFVITIWAQWRIVRAIAAGSKTPAACGRTGAEAALAVLSSHGVAGIAIEPAAGELCDHFDPTRKVLRLSHRIYEGLSLAALGVSAHEAGHAIQQASRYRWLVVRNLIVPLATIGSQVFWLLILAGILLDMDRLILAGIVLFSAVLICQLLNLPVELDASRRGRLALTTTGMMETDEQAIVVEVLNAVAWTYVALTLTGVVSLFAVRRSRSGRVAPNDKADPIGPDS